MKGQKFQKKGEKGFYRVLACDDVEFTNPIEYYSSMQIKSTMTMERDLLSMKDPILTAKISDSFFLKRALEYWDERYKSIILTEIPISFLKLFEAKNKSEQIKLLKEQSITTDQLQSLIFRAWTDFGFSFSQYISEHHHSGLEKEKLPQMIHIEDDGKVKSLGETSMSDGQLKQVIEHRKKTVSKFFDKGDEWHCLFVTYKSLRGEEKAWKNGQPHFHYISDKWGISRDEVVRRLKSKDIISSKVHIDILKD